MFLNIFNLTIYPAFAAGQNLVIKYLSIDINGNSFFVIEPFVDALRM